LDNSYFNRKLERNESEIIEFATISKAFLKYYWHQTCKYKIKQNFNLDKPPLIVKIIQKIFEKDFNSKRTFRVVEKEENDKIITAEREITKEWRYFHLDLYHLSNNIISTFKISYIHFKFSTRIS